MEEFDALMILMNNVNFMDEVELELQDILAHTSDLEQMVIVYIISHLFAHVEATGRPYLFLSTIGHQPDAAFRMVPFKKGSERRCLNGHIMRVLFDIPPLYQNVAAIECDKCRRTGLGNPAGTPFYHCPLCKFDTCVECPLALTPQQGGLGKPLIAPTNSNRA